MKTLYVNWQSSREWVENIDKIIEKLSDKLSNESHKVYHLEYEKKQLETAISKLKNELEELKDHTGVKDKQNVDQAVDNFVGDFY